MSSSIRLPDPYVLKRCIVFVPRFVGMQGRRNWNGSLCVIPPSVMSATLLALARGGRIAGQCDLQRTRPPHHLQIVEVGAVIGAISSGTAVNVASISISGLTASTSVPVALVVGTTQR